MGACTFGNTITGRTPTATLADTFREAAEADRHEYGHSYSGSLGMKRAVVLITGNGGDDEAAYAYADKLIDAGDPRIDDKWGPAGAIALAPSSDGCPRWYIFGWASS